jgi:hypothetical protein
MQVMGKNRLARRLLLLLALSGALLYLRSPVRANAETCQQTCEMLLDTCLEYCEAPPCTICYNAYDVCLEECNK